MNSKQKKIAKKGAIKTKKKEIDTYSNHLSSRLKIQTDRVENALRKAPEGATPQELLKIAKKNYKIEPLVDLDAVFNTTEKRHRAEFESFLDKINITQKLSTALQQRRKTFIFKNTELITKMDSENLRRIQQAIIKNSSDMNALIKRMKQINGINERRAKLIARDQNNKLIGQLNQFRQKEVGINGYIWQSSGDSAVRPDHEENDGKKFNWDNPPAETGHPGWAIQCRCDPIPDITNLK